MHAAVPLIIAGGTLIKTVGGMSAASKNSKLLKAQAREELAMGQDEQARIRQAARRAMGAQVMAQAESGFMPGTGSALDAIEESLINRELDIMTSQRNAEGRASGLRSQAKQVKRQAIFSAIGDAVGAAGAIAGYKADYAQAGEVRGG